MADSLQERSQSLREDLTNIVGAEATTLTLLEYNQSKRVLTVAAICGASPQAVQSLLGTDHLIDEYLTNVLKVMKDNPIHISANSGHREELFGSKHGEVYRNELANLELQHLIRVAIPGFLRRREHQPELRDRYNLTMARFSQWYNPQVEIPFAVSDQGKKINKVYDQLPAMLAALDSSVYNGWVNASAHNLSYTQTVQRENPLFENVVSEPMFLSLNQQDNSRVLRGLQTATLDLDIKLKQLWEHALQGDQSVKQKMYQQIAKLPFASIYPTRDSWVEGEAFNLFPTTQSINSTTFGVQVLHPNGRLVVQLEKFAGVDYSIPIPNQTLANMQETIARFKY